MKLAPGYKINWLLLLIVAVAAALRFYHFSQIPFTYDEVSAWARTGYSSFHDLIQQGVRGDGHPAGIQVFLNYWRKVFGDSEQAFKFPFLVMGLLSIWMIFRIGKFWFNKTVGYIASATTATIQYTVMYSQIARPYISGLFFALMMVWCWSNYLFNGEEKHKRLQLFGYIFFSALCCYDHYFALLFAFIVGLTGLFFLNKENLKQYLVAGFVIVLLFLPHLPITLYQLGIGGVGGWLAKPGPDFFSNYLDYVFEFSPYVKTLIIIVVLLSIFFYSRDLGTKQKFRIIAFLWFIIPLLTGYFYSINRNPVLQYSVLIFSFPWLLFFLFSMYRELRPVYNFILIVVIMVICGYGLIIERDHYGVFYRQPVEELVKNSLKTAKELNPKNVHILINEPRKYAGYYLNKYHEKLPMDYWQEKNFPGYAVFRHYLDSLKSDYFIAGNIPSDYLMLVKEFFPYKIRSDKGFTYNFFAFAKKKNVNVIGDSVFRDSMALGKINPNWKFDMIAVKRDSLDRPLYKMDSTREFGPTFSARLLPLLTNSYNVVNVSLHVRDVKPNMNASLVVSFDEDGKSSFWQEKPFNFFLDSTDQSGYLFYSIGIRDLGFAINNQHSLNAYIWNKGRNEFEIDNMSVEIEAGNPWIYGLIEKVPHKKLF